MVLLRQRLLVKLRPQPQVWAQFLEYIYIAKIVFYTSFHFLFFFIVVLHRRSDKTFNQNFWSMGNKWAKF